MKCAGHDVKLYRLMWIFSLVLVWRVAAAAPASTDRTFRYRFRVWQTEEGLPQNTVRAITQTSDGYLWVGTVQGLARFDGLRFTPVDESAAPELKRGSITALYAGRDGSLWIACAGHGVTRLKDEAFSHLTVTDGLPSNQIHCLLEASDGSLWIGCEGGVARYKEGKFTTYTDRDGLGDNSVRAVCEDRQGTIWIATGHGLSSFKSEGTLGTISVGTNWDANALSSVCEDQQGALWVASNEGLSCLQGDKKGVYGAKEGLPAGTATVVYKDRAGQLWIGTYGGLARMVGGKVVPWSDTEAAFGDRVHVIFEDREGSVWVGAMDGLYRLTPARFTTYTMQQGLTANNVMSVCEDTAGTIWLGIWEGGLNALRGDKITAYRDPTAPSRDLVLSLRQARDGKLWIGTDIAGRLGRFENGSRRSLPKQSGLINAAIHVIHEDRQGTLWIGTSAGLNTLKNGEYRAYTTANGLAGDKVLAICEDGEGNLWIGTEGGLSRWDGGKFANFTTREGLSHNAVDALYADQGPTLWIGTKGGGLNRYQAGKFTAYTSKEGLFSDEIYEILEDDFGYFWMSCRRGIFRVSKKELDDFDRGATKMLACTMFGNADGLLSVQCNGVAKPAGWKGRDGRLWFPTIRGVVAVESRIRPNDLPPPVVIEEVLRDRRCLRSNTVAAAASTQLTVPPGRGEIEIRYTALSLQVPEKNRFQYVLEGQDSGWIDAGPQRVARYNSVAPGTYRFRVIACNDDGVWNQVGATLILELRPHFWQTWWFRLAILAAIGLLLAAAYRFRVARLREIERLRVEIAANLHDDVGARLTKVAMITESLDQQTAEADRNKPHISAIFKTTREIIQAMDEIVWTINPKNDTLDNLADYIFRYAQDYFQNTATRCRLDVPAQLPDCAMSTEARHNLFMAVKEALNNVLKHSGATEVRVSLSVADSKITLLIADNGRGFAVDQARASGNGLRNMKQRLEQIGGQLWLESQPGNGTKIRMEASGE